jgi:hypothetical protein
MTSAPEYYWKQPTRPVKSVIAVAVTAILLTACSGEKQGTAGAAGSASPSVSVVVTPVVKKTVPLLTELTARTYATASV